MIRAIGKMMDAYPFGALAFAMLMVGVMELPFATSIILENMVRGLTK